jgi:hypothetical protein
MRSWLLLPAVIAAVSLSMPAEAQTTASTERPAARPKAAPKRTTSTYSAGHVYLLRGLMNIFSLGMDDLAAKIQAKGIGASVYNHSEWQAIADGITARYKAREHGPVVLVGHSLGADAVMYMAEYLGKKGVPVALVVPFDGTGSFAAASNIGAVYNLTQRDYAHMRRGAGFRGRLENIDVSGQGYGHIDIDKSARLHAQVIGRIQTVIRSRGVPQTAGDAPRPRPAPAQAPAAQAPAAQAPAAQAAPEQSKPAPAAAPAAPESAPAAPAAAAPAPATTAPVPATTASTTGAANPAATRAAASTPPAASRPATVPVESSARRTPASPEAGAKPALRF